MLLASMRFRETTSRSAMRSRLKTAGLTAIIVAGTLGALQDARADEGGISFWLPGIYGSLAALPQQPGWAPMVAYPAMPKVGMLLFMMGSSEPLMIWS